MVMSVANSHHTSTSKKPTVAASDAANATRNARLISVIMPGQRSESSTLAPRRKTLPPYTKTTVPRIAGIHRDPGNVGAV